jgi:hypothetical protein
MSVCEGEIQSKMRWLFWVGMFTALAFSEASGVRYADACSAVPAKPTYVLSDFQGVPAPTDGTPYGFGNNVYGFVNGTCSTGATGNDPAKPMGCLGLCSSATCSQPFQITQCGGGAPPPAPLTCSDAGYFGDDPGGICPSGQRCTGKTVGGKNCVCGPTEQWTGTYCGPTGPPPPGGACTTNFPPIPGNWNKHRCAKNGCAPSMMPTVLVGTSPSPLPGNITSLANPMAACCGMGWGEDGDGASKFDCVEAKPQPSETFAQFYSVGSSANDLATAGLTFPNALFLVDRAGTPINGFYTQSGARCALTPNLTVPEQHQIYREAILHGAAPSNPIWTVDGAPWAPAATVPETCCFLLTFALERDCPATDTKGGVKVATTDGATRRCSAAESQKIHFGLYDLCRSNTVRRYRFKPATSVNTDPTAITYKSDPLNATNLIHAFYPTPPSPLPSPCPASSAVLPLPWTLNECIINPN